MITKEDIIIGLKDLKISHGDVLLVHSSLSSFGKVKGGAETVVDAILDVIGDDGTLVVPTFTYGNDVFDPVQSPSLCGAITEAVRKRPNAVRSSHPTHSVAAIGPLADVITEGHEKIHAFARGSALFKVLQANGKILQLGVDNRSSSMIHVAEEIAAVPYIDRQRSASFRTPQGKIVKKWIRRPGCSQGFDAIEEPLLEKDAIREELIGDCRARVMVARTVVNTALEMLKTDPEALLCNRADCEWCAESRAMIAATEAEEIDKEIIEISEQDERALRMVERQFEGMGIREFEPERDETNPN